MYACVGLFQIGSLSGAWLWTDSRYTLQAKQQLDPDGTSPLSRARSLSRALRLSYLCERALFVPLPLELMCASALCVSHCSPCMVAVSLCLLLSLSFSLSHPFSHSFSLLRALAFSLSRSIDRLIDRPGVVIRYSYIIQPVITSKFVSVFFPCEKKKMRIAFSD